MTTTTKSASQGRTPHEAPSAIDAIKSIAQAADALEIRWADHKPTQHKHRISDWSLVDFTNDDGEICVMCSMCEMAWHTGIVEVESEDDEREYAIRDLIRQATRWIERQQLPLPLNYANSPAVARLKRRYTPSPRVDLSAQLPLLWAA